MRTLSLSVLTCIFLTALGIAQEEARPSLVRFECPTYPSQAASIHLQGMVKLQVSTDGARVSAVKIYSGHPLLSKAAEQNVRTWELSEHKPTSFSVNYVYVNEGNFKPDPATNCAAKMELPRVTISTRF